MEGGRGGRMGGREGQGHEMEPGRSRVTSLYSINLTVMQSLNCATEPSIQSYGYSFVSASLFSCGTARVKVTLNQTN